MAQSLRKQIKAKIRKKRIASGNKYWVQYYKKADDRYLRRRYNRVKNVPIDPNLLFFESFLGRNIADSPLAMFKEIVNDPAYAGYRFVWSVTDVKKNVFLERNPRVKVVKRNSQEYYDSIASAHYVVNNITNNILAPKKEGQIYIQTWHGTPLKRLGMDISLDGNGLKTVDEIHIQYRREADTFDYLISPSKYTSDKLASAFGLSEEEKEKKIVELGYPRNSYLFTCTEEEKAALRSEYGIPEGKKVILYCTTWREQTYTAGEGFKFDVELDIDRLYRRFGESACVVMRMHYNHKNTKIDFESYPGFLINGTAVDEINKLFVLADMLITDYSSVMFDYANLKRPEIFYMYDRDRYENEIRGFYFDASELPGPIVKNQDELEDAIDKVIKEGFTPDEKYNAFCDRFTYLDDADAAKRVVQHLIPGKKEPDELSPALLRYIKKTEKKYEIQKKLSDIKNNGIVRVLTAPVRIAKGCLAAILKFTTLDKYRIGAAYANAYKKCNIDEKAILYESFFGRGLLCGPYALFLEALADERMKDFVHYWSIDDKDDIKRLKAEYAGYNNVRFVYKQSKKYMEMLSTAKYLVNNASFPYYFTKKDGQVYVNTWHGIPLKSLGFDMPNGKTETSNVLRNMLISDYMVSASPFLTEIYEKSYKLSGLYNGKIIEEGYPRLDILTNGTRLKRIEKLQRYGVEIDPDKQIILYAPTWSGSSYATASSDVSGLFEFKKKLEKIIDNEKYQILVKPHQRVFQLASDKLKESWIVPASLDANEVLGVTDILVSDFSSIFYDFLYTGKPILFFIENIEAYSRERGLYRNVNEALPGPISKTVEGIGEYINDIRKISEEWKEKYAEIAEYANVNVKPNISKRILDIVFFNKEEGYAIKKVACDKTRLLLSRGRLGVNGISTSLLNLMSHIDYDKYDVTLMIEKSPDDTKSDFIGRIDPNVRVVYRTQMPPMTGLETAEYRGLRRFGRDGHRISAVIEREWKRNFANTYFDVAVDFCGYIFMNAAVIAKSNSGLKCIWQHNDMMAEYKLKHKELKMIFKIYDMFDRVVSCGKEIMKINYDKLPAKYKAQERLTFAGNVIDGEMILKGAKKHPTVIMNETDAKSGEEAINFLTIGRLSPEKNHTALINAFKRFHTVTPNSNLYIIGDGPMRKELNRTIAMSGLWQNIIATGNINNPYPLLNKCDCFILPSLYEGLPMTVYEARVLHKPIILSDFGSSAECVMENGQIVIGKTEDAIFKAMCAFRDGYVPTGYKFDVKKYNQEKIEEFYKAIEVK